MKIAIKKIDIYKSKLNTSEIEKKFGAQKIGELDYQTEFADQLNEIIFEFHAKYEVDFVSYLRNHCVTGRIFT